MNYFEEYNNNEKIAFLVTEYDEDAHRVVYHIRLYNHRKKHKIFKCRDKAVNWLERHNFVGAYE